jgi:hypothetical protein
MSCLVPQGEAVLGQRFRGTVVQWELLPDARRLWLPGGYVAVTRPSAGEGERREAGYGGTSLAGTSPNSQGITGAGSRNNTHHSAARSTLPRQLLYDHPQGLRARPNFLIRVLWYFDIRPPTRDDRLTKEHIRFKIDGEVADFDVIFGLRFVFEFISIITCGFIAWHDIPPPIQTLIKNKPLLYARFQSPLSMLPLNRLTALEDMASATLSYLTTSGPARGRALRLSYFVDTFTHGHLRRVLIANHQDGPYKVICLFSLRLAVPGSVPLEWNHAQLETDDTGVLCLTLTSLEEATFGEVHRIYHFPPAFRREILDRACAHDPDDEVVFAPGTESPETFAILLHMLDGTHPRKIMTNSVLDTLLTKERAPLYLPPPFPHGPAKIHIFWWLDMPRLLVTHDETQQQMLVQLSSTFIDILEQKMEEYKFDHRSFSSLPANIDPVLVSTLFPHPPTIARLHLKAEEENIRDVLAGHRVVSVFLKNQYNARAKLIAGDNMNMPASVSTGVTTWRLTFDLSGGAHMHAVNLQDHSYTVLDKVPVATQNKVRAFLKAHGIETSPDKDGRTVTRNIPPAYQFTGAYDDNQLLYARAVGDRYGGGAWKNSDIKRVSEFYVNGVRPADAPNLGDGFALRPRPPNPPTHAHPLVHAAATLPPVTPALPVAAPVLSDSSPLSSPPASDPGELGSEYGESCENEDEQYNDR